MNKKKSLEAILIVFALALIIQVAPTLGAMQTDITWDTSGSINIDIWADDDAETHFYTGGNHIFGEFHAIDYNDDPYGYGVDTVEVWANATVEGGGFIDWTTIRTDSHESMYGEAGQERGILIDTDDYGFAKWKDNINYARYRGCQYGFQNDEQLQASGNYFMGIYLTDSDGDGMAVSLQGSGSGKITVMNSESWGSSWKFGKGCGCYTNAKASASGSGYFEASGWASNYLKSDFGFELPNGGDFIVAINFNDGLTVDNFASEGE